MKKWSGFEHGINLGGWLSQCDHTKERYDTFVTKDDIRNISSWGLDHIRVPIDYDLVENKAGNYKEEGFRYIQNAIDWAREYKLNMILDLHKTFGFSFDLATNEKGFLKMNFTRKDSINYGKSSLSDSVSTKIFWPSNSLMK